MPNEHWNTPQPVLDCVYRVGEVDLDPCSNAGSIVKSKRKFMLPEKDGLVEPWGEGLVFVNPPYGRKSMPLWVDKIWKEEAEVITLVPASTEQPWCQRLMRMANALCFWKGRIRFVGAPTGATFPSLLTYHGTNPETFCAAFEDHGKVVLL